MPSIPARIILTLLKHTRFLRQDAHAVKRQRRLMEDASILLIPVREVTAHLATDCPVPGMWLHPPGAPSQRVLLHIHGGAFTYGSLRTHRALVSRIARAAESRALVINYRLAPEHPFPAALEDCLAAFHWLVGQGIPAPQIAICGDSAGANLALALIMALKKAGEPLPGRLACLSPVSDLSWAKALKPEVVARDPILVPADIHLVMGYIGNHNPSDPLLSPALGNLEGFPPVLIHVGAQELLQEDAQRLFERAQAAGVVAQLKIWPGMWHVFQVVAPYVPESRQSIDEIGAFIRSC